MKKIPNETWITENSKLVNRWFKNSKHFEENFPQDVLISETTKLLPEVSTRNYFQWRFSLFSHYLSFLIENNQIKTWYVFHFKARLLTFERWRRGFRKSHGKYYVFTLQIFFKEVCPDLAIFSRTFNFPGKCHVEKKMLKKVDIKKFHYRSFLENVVSEIRDNFQESTYDRVDLD